MPVRNITDFDIKSTNSVMEKYMRLPNKTTNSARRNTGYWGKRELAMPYKNTANF